jgi:imidazolonepropionase-like amidohydrolase
VLDGVEVTEYAGTVLPGLIDRHTHLVVDATSGRLERTGAMSPTWPIDQWRTDINEVEDLFHWVLASGGYAELLQNGRDRRSDLGVAKDLPLLA